MSTTRKKWSTILPEEMIEKLPAIADGQGLTIAEFAERALTAAMDQALIDLLAADVPLIVSQQDGAAHVAELNTSGLIADEFVARGRPVPAGYLGSPDLLTADGSSLCPELHRDLIVVGAPKLNSVSGWLHGLITTNFSFEICDCDSDQPGDETDPWHVRCISENICRHRTYAHNMFATGHTDWGVVALRPNPCGGGNILLLAGLGVVGTFTCTRAATAPRFLSKIRHALKCESSRDIPYFECLVSLRAAGTVFETVEPFPGSVRRIDG